MIIAVIIFIIIIMIIIISIILSLFFSQNFGFQDAVFSSWLRVIRHQFHEEFKKCCTPHIWFRFQTSDSRDRQPAKREGGRPGRGPPRGPVPDPRRGPLLMKFLVYQWNPNQMYGVPPESYMELGVPPES